MVITTSVQTLDGSWIYCYTCYIFGRAPRINDTLPNFCENTDPDKWDITVWYQITRNPQEFHGLSTGPPNFGGVTGFTLCKVS